MTVNGTLPSLEALIHRACRAANSFDKSSTAWQDLSAQQAHAHALAAQQTPQTPPQSAPSMGM